MPRRGKKIDEARNGVDRAEPRPADDAFDLVKELSFVKFDESMDAAVRLAVNPRHADQNVRGSVLLPNGTGKSVRVAVFAKGEKATEAEEAGADVVGAEDLVAKIQNEGFLDFDTAIATPDMMKFVGRIGRVLGPRGLMPNPKTGSVTFDVGLAVKAAKGGKVDFRVDKAGIVHCGIGRRSFETEKLVENLQALIEKLMRLKPASAKGNYLRGIIISSTMGPGVRVDPSSLT
jgi:large subunit ribosomal protein L1